MARERRRSVLPAMERKEILLVLSTIDDVPVEYKISSRIVFAPMKLMMRIRGKGYLVEKLSEAEEARGRAYGKIMEDSEEWATLSAKERFDVRQDLTDLLGRRSMNL